MTPRLIASTRHLLGAALLFAGAFHARAAQVAATEIAFPFFNDAGQLTHRLLAKSGSMEGSVQRLKAVEIVYYAPDDPERVVQRVEADAATWNLKTEVLEGTGGILVATEENELAGQGFHFALGTARLQIQRAFRMEGPELVLTSDRAVIDLIVDRKGEDPKVRDVRRCEAIGNLVVVVQPTAKQKHPFDRAYSERAIYDGAARTITLPEPIRYEKQGRPAGGTNELVITLKPRVGGSLLKAK